MLFHLFLYFALQKTYQAGRVQLNFLPRILGDRKIQSRGNLHYGFEVNPIVLIDNPNM